MFCIHPKALWNGLYVVANRYLTKIALYLDTHRKVGSNPQVRKPVEGIQIVINLGAVHSRQSCLKEKNLLDIVQ